jgi:Fic family protein
MKRGLTGEFVVKKYGDETVNAFMPRPLPPDPPLDINHELHEALNAAHLSLGRLDGIAERLPETGFFLYTYVRKEAVLSSQIEGTQSSLSELLLFELEEAPGTPLKDVVEVSNYVAALEHGLRRLKENFPLSSRLIRDVHRVLLAKGRGSDKEPGEFRRSQNWISGTRPGNAVFVPPPPDRVPEAMGDLEKYLHDIPDKTSTLIKSALAHAQFETIHPFLDGNGRIGRLMITLILCKEGVLREPLLYLSLYFKRHRARYYDLLQKTRTEGDWEGWLLFYAHGVRETADAAVGAARKLSEIAATDQRRIQEIGRPAGSALRVHQVFLRKPLQSIQSLSRETRLSAPTVTAALQALQKIGVVKEITGHKRNRFYCYKKYLDILSQGTEI